MGRRQQREQRTFAAILSASGRLFGEMGYDAATVEMIADEAGVSPGTVYNYFGTKSAILTTVVARQSEDAIDEASTSLDLSAPDPVDALMPVIEAYVDVTLGFGVEQLRELFVAVLDTSEPRLAKEMWSVDERAIVQIAEALARMQVAGAVRASVNPADAALVVYSLIATAIIVFISIPGTTPANVKEIIHRQLTLVFDGLGPR